MFLKQGLHCRRSYIAVAAVLAPMGGFAADATPSPSSPVTERTFALREHAGTYAYWRNRKATKAYREAIKAFGVPSSRGKTTPLSNVCVVRWEPAGVDVGFAGATIRSCSDADLHRSGWYGMRLWGEGWHTARGLRVGDPVTKISALYPRARYRSQAPDRPEWILISEWQQDSGRVPLLIAEVGAGRVIALRVPAGFVF